MTQNTLMNQYQILNDMGVSGKESSALFAKASKSGEIYNATSTNNRGRYTTDCPTCRGLSKELDTLTRTPLHSFY
jgi:hypothetical protein